MNKKVEKLLNSNVFCILPWVNLQVGATGDIALCCNANFPKFSLGHISQVNLSHHFNFKEFENIRRKILNGERIFYCQECYKVEQNNGLSLRQSFLEKHLGSFAKTFGFPTKEDFLSSIINLNGAWDRPPMFLDLKPGNLCNLQCRMCGPYSSNQTYVPEKHGYKIENVNLDWLDDEQNLKQIQLLLNHTIRLKIGGGEPTIMKNVFKLLDYCVEHGVAKHIELFVTTNGLRVDRLIKYLNHFKQFNITISIDAISDVYEYIRYPAQWKNTEKNFLKLLSQEKLNISLNTVIMLLNIFHVFDFLEWIDKVSRIRKFTVNTIFLNKPEYYSPFVAPLGIRQNIAQKLQEKIKSLNNLDEQTRNNFFYISKRLKEAGYDKQKRKAEIKNFIVENDFHDQIKKQNIWQVTPELKRVIR